MECYATDENTGRAVPIRPAIMAGWGDVCDGWALFDRNTKRPLRVYDDEGWLLEDEYEWMYADACIPLAALDDEWDEKELAEHLAHDLAIPCTLGRRFAHNPRVLDDAYEIHPITQGENMKNEWWSDIEDLKELEDVRVRAHYSTGAVVEGDLTPPALSSSTGSCIRPR